MNSIGRGISGHALVLPRRPPLTGPELYWIRLDMEALQLDKLLEPKFTEADALSTVLPSGPCEIL